MLSSLSRKLLLPTLLLAGILLPLASPPAAADALNGDVYPNVRFAFNDLGTCLLNGVYQHCWQVRVYPWVEIAVTGVRPGWYRAEAELLYDWHPINYCYMVSTAPNTHCSSDPTSGSNELEVVASNVLLCRNVEGRLYVFPGTLVNEEKLVDKVVYNVCDRSPL